MKNSSRLLAKIARNRARSSSGSARVLGQLEHALVEVQPRELAVEEPVVELLHGRDLRGVGDVGRLDVEGVGGVAEGLGDRALVDGRRGGAGEGGGVRHAPSVAPRGERRMTIEVGAQ